MSHNVFGAKLSRDTDQRKALLKGLAGAMIRSEAIETTEAKAKAARDLIENLVTHAKSGKLSDIRIIESVVADKDLVNKLVHDIAPRFATRQGGYLRLIKTGFRVGDNAPLVRMEFTDPAVAKPIVATTPKAKKEVKEAKVAPKKVVKAAPAKKAVVKSPVAKKTAAKKK